MPSYVVGVDFGTESGRAVVIDTADGRELGSSVYRYANGVIDAQLPAPDDDVRLGPDWALQDPEDYLRTFQQAVPAALAAAGVDPAAGGGRGHRLHGLHDAAHEGGRHAPLHAARAAPRTARLGQALEAPCRPAGGRPHQRGRARAR